MIPTQNHLFQTSEKKEQRDPGDKENRTEISRKRNQHEKCWVAINNKLNMIVKKHEVSQT